MGNGSEKAGFFFFYFPFIKCLISLCTDIVYIDYPLIPVKPGLFCCTQKKMWSVSVTTLPSTQTISSCFLCFLLWLSHGDMVSHVALSKGSCFLSQMPQTTRLQGGMCPPCLSLPPKPLSPLSL